MTEQRLTVNKSKIAIDTSSIRQRIEIALFDGERWTGIEVDRDQAREVIKMLNGALEDLRNG